ncbi:MAG: NAD(P)-binding domain-containing protein [candidate division Zixibacteria bacterium]|nr:NAD(P)-binding domain-containing protein [candidate division Zixibacteria bacterium]
MSNESIIEFGIYIIVGLITFLIPYFYIRRYKSKAAESAKKHDENIKTGITEPTTLHPKIDPNSCISTGACVSACPEGEILGIVDGHAKIISPTKCIGHGACQVACPTDAISLVFGTAQRGVDLPTVKETFETNVEGIYIAGELGGMGLIRNAITQGREAVEYISKSRSSNQDCDFDLIIIGAGPAGIAAGLQAKKDGLNYVIFEQENDLGGTVLSFPRQKLVMTQPMVLPLYGKFNRREIQKEELLDLWNSIAKEYELNICTSSKVEKISRNNSGYHVDTPKGNYKAGQVLLSIGRRGSPRKLGVKGENLSKVTYKLLEPEQYKNKHLLVVGGGDSAIEATIALGEQAGTTVTLSYRKSSFGRIKDGNQTRLEAAVSTGWLNIIYNSTVLEISNDTVLLKCDNDENNNKILPNDFVFIFIGGELPTTFLKNIGIEMQTKFGVA